MSPLLRRRTLTALFVRRGALLMKGLGPDWIRWLAVECYNKLQFGFEYDWKILQ